MNKLAELLFRYIHDQNITQKDAAKMLGISRNTLTNWKSGGKIDAKNAEAIREFTKDWDGGDPELDAVIQELLKTLRELSLVDRCRVLAFAADLKSGAIKPVPARKLRCPICHAELPAEWKDGETNECPTCKQHIRGEP